MENRETEPIVMVGTVHQGTDDAPHFVANLSRMLLTIAPEIILAELTPEQADGRATITSKPEYESAIFPAASELAAQIIPIQPDEGSGLEFERRAAEAEAAIRSESHRAIVWETWGTFAQQVGLGLIEVVSAKDGMDPVRSFAIDGYLFEPWQTAMQELFPEYMDGWVQFNRLLLERILAAYRPNEHKRCVITVGMAHRLWLRQHLKEAGVTVISPSEAGA